MDARAGVLLAYLGGRVTVTVGDNAGRIAAAAGLSPHEFDVAAAELCAGGLAYREPLGERAWRLGITDAGVELLAKQHAGGTRRPWWRLW